MSVQNIIQTKKGQASFVILQKKHNACIYSVSVEIKGLRIKGAWSYVEICEEHNQCSLYTDKKGMYSY